MKHTLSTSNFLSQGGDLRQVRAEMRGVGAAVDRAELPRDRHPQGHEPRGEAVQVVFTVLFRDIK